MPNIKENSYYIYAYHSIYTDEIGGSMFLAVQTKEKNYLPLNSSFGVLFPKAELNEGKLCGTTKIMIFPWVFRMSDGSFGIVALRRNTDNSASLQMPKVTPEPQKGNCLLFFRSKDLLSYEETGLFEAAPKGTLIHDVSCQWNGEQYEILMKTDQGGLKCVSSDLQHFSNPQATDRKPLRVMLSVDDAAPACKIEVTEEEYEKIVKRLTPLTNIGVKPIEVAAKAGEPLELPDAELTYSDGSVFHMPVQWAPFNAAGKGTYTVTGTLKQQVCPTLLTSERGDPMAVRFRGKYYYMATDDEHGQLALKIRVADSINEIAEAQDHVILAANPERNRAGCFWAPELHIIKNNLFIIFAVGNPYWYTVQCHGMKLIGDDPLNTNDWSEPIRCQKKDGSVLCENGITLDMTVLTTETDVYTIWAQRQICNPDNHGNSDLYIAKVDPNEPWRFISDPVLLKQPIYGWERIHAEVNEGPFVLKHNDDIFVTYAGALIDHTYCVGLLHAKVGADLLDPQSWEVSNYPVLHRNSVPDQIGAGHNSFVKDENGNDVLMIHAIPFEHYRNNPADTRRYPVFRTIHWDSEQFPRLDMTSERWINPLYSKISATVHLL